MPPKMKVTKERLARIEKLSTERTEQPEPISSAMEIKWDDFIFYVLHVQNDDIALFVFNSLDLHDRDIVINMIYQNQKKYLSENYCRKCEILKKTNKLWMFHEKKDYICPVCRTVYYQLFYGEEMDRKYINPKDMI